MGGGRGFGGGGFHSSSGGFRSSAPAGGRGFAPGGARGFASGPRVFAPSGPRVFAPGGRRTFAPAPRTFAPRTFASGGFGVRNFAPGHRTFVPFPGRTVGFRHFHGFHNHFFFPGCFGCVSPFFFGSGFFFGDPFFPGYWPAAYPAYAPGYAYAPPPDQPVVASSDNGSNAELAVEVERLSDEVAGLREENRRAAAANNSITVTEPVATVSFIFRNGQKVSAKNYAIAGDTLWVLDEHAARKFALSDLDIPATQQTNAANGVEIHFPTVPRE